MKKLFADKKFFLIFLCYFFMNGHNVFGSDPTTESMPSHIEDCNDIPNNSSAFLFQWRIETNSNSSFCESLLQNDTLTYFDLIEKCIRPDGKPMFYLQYLICNQNRTFEKIDFKNFDRKLVKMMMLKLSSTTNNHLFFEWNPKQSTIELLNSDCSNDFLDNDDDFNQQDSNSNCTYLINLVKNSVTLFLFDRKKSTIFEPNINLDHSFVNGSMVLRGEEQKFYYNDSYIKLKLENSTELVVKYDKNSQQSIIDLFNLAGNANMKAQLVRTGTSLEDLFHLDQSLIIDLDPNVIMSDNNQTNKRVKRSSFDFQLTMDRNSIKTVSHPRQINIPFKNEITEIKYVNSTFLTVLWSEPSGTYDKIVLICMNGQEPVKSIYINKTFGFCISEKSLGGLELTIFTKVEKSSVEYISSNIVYYVVLPDPVKNIKTTKSFNDSLYFSWTQPDGLIDSYLVTCSLVSIGVVLSAKVELNTTNSSSCSNLLPSSSYEVYVSSIRNVDNKMYSNGAKTYLNTLSSNDIFCYDEICFELQNILMTNVSEIPDRQLIYLIEKVAELIDKLSNEYFFNRRRTKLISLADAISFSSDFLFKISTRFTILENKDVVSSFMDLVDKLLNQSASTLTESQYSSNSSSNAEKILSKFNFTNENNFFDKYLGNLHFSTRLVTPSSMYSPFDFSYNLLSDDSKNYILKDKNLKIAAHYNRDALKDAVQKNLEQRLSFIGFMTSKFFISQNVANFEQSDYSCSVKKQVSPYVLSMSPLDGVKPRNDLVTVLFDQLENEKSCKLKFKNVSFECVFWDENRNDWNNYGCKHSFQLIDNNTYHKCNCNHTTNFAVLMIADDEPFCDWCDKVLFYVSMIGVCLSIIGLVITITYDIIIAVLSRIKKLNPPTRKFNMLDQYYNMSKQYLKIIILWCLTILITDCFYIAFSTFNFSFETKLTKINETIVEISQPNRASCISIGVILHYFLLSSFFFSFTITLLQFFIFYRSFKIIKFVLLKASIFSFGIPLIIVSIILIIDVNAYINTNRYCWLKPNFAIYGSILPIAIILIINFVLFILIVINHTYLSKKREKYLQKYQETNGINKEIILILTCFVNTGLTWLFGFLVTIPGQPYVRFIFGLLFCILNSTQGFHIFIVYILISKRRREILKDRLISQLKEIKQRLN